MSTKDTAEYVMIFAGAALVGVIVALLIIAAG